MKTETFNAGTVMRWFQCLNILNRQLPAGKIDRFLECFWESQLSSKLWLIEVLEERNLLGHLSNVPVYVYGGWYGVLAQLLYDKTRGMIISVDIDPDCENYGSYFAPDVLFLTDDMTKHVAPSIGAVSINTSSEHITQEEYDQWLANRRKGNLVIVQGNNFFSNPEHVRCHHTLKEFVQASASTFSQVLYVGSLDCGDFTRFMVIGFV